ncbi:amino acid permease [Candidatus Woesearchaeota archaeon]|nr:amino acid permease [Candidatus Woesearchaeota archaeon]
MTISKDGIRLKKGLSLWQTTFAGVGIILGAGIYVLIGSAAGMAGNAVWLSFLLAAFVAAFTGLSYAEFSSLYSKDEGEYIYAEKSFSKRIGFLVVWLIFFEGVISAAAVALGFGGYFSSLFANIVTIPVFLVAILLVVILSFINYYGLEQSSWLNVFFTAIETIGLLFIIFIGIPKIGSVNLLEMPNGFAGVSAAAALIFFAFIGFEAVIKLAEETKSAKKVIPKALVLSIIITTIIYILVAVTAVSILDYKVLGESKAPLADVAASVFGDKAFFILSVIALFSTGNTVLLLLLTTSRLTYGMGHEYRKLRFLSRVHEKRKTPWIAVILVMLFTMIFTLFKDITLVASITDFTIYGTFITVNAALIVSRYKYPKLKRTFRSPCNIGKFPVLAFLGIISSLFMLFHLNSKVVIGGIILTAIGYAMYSLVCRK